MSQIHSDLVFGMFPYINRLRNSGGAPETLTLKMAKSPTRRSRRKEDLGHVLKTRESFNYANCVMQDKW